MSHKPEVIRVGLLNAQICVPCGWSDKKATDFVNANAPTGISSRWTIRKKGHEGLCGDPERRDCDKREGFVHITFEC